MPASLSLPGIHDSGSSERGLCDSRHKDDLAGTGRGSPLPGLPFCLRSACRAKDIPAHRTHALLPCTRASGEVRTPPPRQAVVPFRRSTSVASGGDGAAHPPGQHVPQTADKPERNGAIPTMFNKIILIGRLGQNEESGTAQNSREHVVLSRGRPSTTLVSAL